LPQDGLSPSLIAVRVFDATGSPARDVTLLVDLQLVGGSLVNLGTLSSQKVVTGSDGRATLVYTAPPPPPLASCDAVPSTVAIQAIAIGNNAQSFNPFSADVRIVPVGVVIPSTDTPTTPKASFTFTPTNPSVNQSVTFNASLSTAAPGRVIVNYGWDFADGTIKNGVNVTHDFGAPGCRKVTLTVIDNTGQSGSIKQQITVF
jgi:PKD repeat protein